MTSRKPRPTRTRWQDIPTPKSRDLRGKILELTSDLNDVVRIVVSVAKDNKLAPLVRMKAVEWLADRAEGKAVEKIDINTQNHYSILHELNLDQLKALARHDALPGPVSALPASLGTTSVGNAEAVDAEVVETKEE